MTTTWNSWRSPLLALALSGCTLVGAGTGATTAELTGGSVKHDMEVGALIGLGVDVAVAIYLMVAGTTLQSSN